MSRSIRKPSPRWSARSLHKAFGQVCRFVSRADQGLSKTRFVRCVDIDRMRGPLRTTTQKRAFMHTGHYPSTICYASASVFLPPEYFVGILLHEFGHLGSKGGEEAADRWVKKRLGISLEYACPVALERVTPATAKKILSR